MFQTIAEIKGANKKLGKYFFSESTMRFFDSTVIRSAGVQNSSRGSFFITSEVDPSGDRRYTVRVADADGDVDTAGRFHAYADLAHAKAARDCLAKGLDDEAEKYAFDYVDPVADEDAEIDANG